MNSRIPSVAILLASIALAVVAVRWADREFQRVEPPSESFRPVPRPQWVWAMNRPYRRLQHALTWVCVAATFGAALEPKTWQRPVGTVVIVVFLVGGLTVAHYLLAAPPIFRRNADCYGLRNALQMRVPGAIMGAWAVTWGRKSDWRERLIGWLWMSEVGMLVAYGVLFG